MVKAFLNTESTPPPGLGGLGEDPGFPRRGALACRGRARRASPSLREVAVVDRGFEGWPIAAIHAGAVRLDVRRLGRPITAIGVADGPRPGRAALAKAEPARPPVVLFREAQLELRLDLVPERVDLRLDEERAVVVVVVGRLHLRVLEVRELAAEAQQRLLRAPEPLRRLEVLGADRRFLRRVDLLHAPLGLGVEPRGVLHL